MPVRIVVIAESDADRRHVCGLVDRMIHDHAPGWWDDGSLEHEREWCGLEAGTLFTRWDRLKQLPLREGALRQSALIGFRAEAGQRGYDYPLARKALGICLLARPVPDAVLLVRDMDRQPKERAASMRRAAGEFGSLRVVLALPETKREAWVLNGFRPRDAGERERYAEVAGKFGFDLVRRPEELAAAEHGAKRDVKRVLRAIMDEDREAACWLETPWEALRKNGEGSGLAPFLADVRSGLVPLFEARGRAG